MKNITLSDDECALARATFERAISDVYVSATAEEYEDVAAEREKMSAAERKMAALRMLADKFA